ncbi:MAG: helix-turn-helix transcriptional regulator [Clostridiales bacterium]|nr:helix-turn-helix transcriptional regulator [Clostridiales bacterium]
MIDSDKLLVYAPGGSVPSAECDSVHEHPDMAALRQMMPPEERLDDLAELYKIFGDSTRVKILYALLEAEMCVCDIASLLCMTQSAISHQLRMLKQTKLVKSRRAGKTVFYSLADDHVSTILSMGMEHLEET